MCTGTSDPAEESHFLRRINQLRQFRQVLFTGADGGSLPEHGTRRVILRNLHPRHVAGQHDYGHSAFSDCTLHGDVKNTLKLLRIRNQLTVVTAFFEKNFRMSFLEISSADLTAWNMRCDREYRSIAAMSIEESVDQVKVAGTAAASAGRSKD